MGISESRYVYNKKDLIENFKRDLGYVYITTLENRRNPAYNNIISGMELTSNTLKFKFTDYFINNINIKDTNRSEHIDEFNVMWSNRIFEGTNAFYKFGNIFTDTKIDKDSFGRMISITFPFYKIDKPLHIYFDVIPDVILFEILQKIDKVGLNSMLKLYPKLKYDNNLFKFLIKTKYAKIFDVLNEVYNDIPDYEKYKWSSIYEELVSHEKDKEFKSMLDENSDFMVKKLNIPFLAVRALIKYHYPLMYNKLNYSLSDTPYYYNELISSKNNIIFQEYLKTGLLPENYKITKVDIIINIEITLIYILLLDNNVKFDNVNTYIYAINKITEAGILAHSLFTQMGKDKVIELINLIKNNNKYEELLNKAKYFSGIIII